MAQQWDLSCKAEYHRARVVLLHEPSSEILSALLWPEASSFEEVYDSDAAINEHRYFQQYLRHQGIAVYLLKDLLAGHPNLHAHAAKALDYPNQSPSISKKDEIVSALGISDKIRLLVERPKLRADSTTGASSPQFQSLDLSPLSNLYFMRDQLIVTNKGIIVGRFKEDVRQDEQDIVKLALEVIGIGEQYRITEPGVLEGGDFIPAGDWGLFGCGERTNYCENSRVQICTDHGICQLLRGPGAAALDFRNIAVIKDPDPSKQEMHLDTYFMLVAQDVCLIEETRVDPPIIGHKDRRPRVDIYEKSSYGQDYNIRRQDYPFEDFLRDELGLPQTGIVRLPPQDQKEYGVNVLCLQNKKIVGSYSKEQEPIQKQSYEEKLTRAGITFDLIDFTNIRKGYGSNHCMSQVLLRDST